MTAGEPHDVAAADGAAGNRPAPRDRIRDVGRWTLGATLVLAGVSHLTFQRDEFQAQVPGWFPLDVDAVVIASGMVEIALGIALLVLVRRRVVVGWVVAAFFIGIFPGNIAQWVDGVDAFGLDTDAKRFIRLFFQPLLVAWALWSTGAWRAWRTATEARRRSA
jgi:uncharacterized membrane protein